MTHLRYVILVLAVCIVIQATTSYGEPYRIMTNSPIHVAGAGNETVLLYGQAPDAQWVVITMDDMHHRAEVRDGSFSLVVSAPPPGTYIINGTWGSRTLEPSSTGWAETTTTGHLYDGLLTVTGTTYDTTPHTTITILDGAHTQGCTDCIRYTDDIIQVGGHILVSNADTERHRFDTDAYGAASSTGDLEGGESIRLPLHHEGEATYGCIYHPWVQFTIQSTSRHTPQTTGTIHLEIPSYATDIIQMGITHTASAQVAHVIFIQDGQVLSAGTASLTDGYGVYRVDTEGWRVGEVIVSVSAGMDHATDSISVRPPPGSIERVGIISGYDGPDGILINGGLARPGGIIPLDAAASATQQLCRTGDEALFRGDIGLGDGRHYTEGTVWCGGVNLGVYLLESGLAIADPIQCRMASAVWLAPYCGITPTEVEVPDVVDTPSHDTIIDDTPHDITIQTPPIQSGDTQPDTPTITPDDDIQSDIIIPGTIIPDPATLAEPYTPIDVCDHWTDPECPCPEGWVRNGEWCDPDIQDVVEDTADTIHGGITETREEAVDALGGVFGRISHFFGTTIPQFFMNIGGYSQDRK